MKVAIIGTAYPFRGGIAAFNERLAKAYIDEGHEVEIFTFTTQYPNFLFPGKSQYSDGDCPSFIKPKRVLSSVNPFTWFKAAKMVVNYQPDLVICKFWLPFMGPSLGTVLKLIRRKCDAPIISVLDNVVPHEKRIGDKPFTSYFLSKLDSAIAMSQAVWDDFRKFEPNKKLILSEHPIYDNFGEATSEETARKQLGLSDSKKYLLFFGIVRDYKGLDILIEAMPKIREGNPDVELVVAGEYYGNQEFYEELIEKNNLKDCVHLHSKFIPDEEVKNYFCACDLVVQPYKSATQSGVTQIAYHFEKPMVVTNVGGLPEMCPDGKVGYITEVSPNSVAEGVLKYFQNREKVDFIGNIKEEKKRYSWERMLANINKLIKE